MTKLSTETYILYNKTIIRGRNVLVQNVRGRNILVRNIRERNVQVQNVPWRNVLGAKRPGCETSSSRKPSGKKSVEMYPLSGPKRPIRIRYAMMTIPIATPLIVYPTLIVHVDKRCDCNAYSSRWTISIAIATLIVHMDNKRCTCNVYCHP